MLPQACDGRRRILRLGSSFACFLCGTDGLCLARSNARRGFGFAWSVMDVQPGIEVRFMAPQAELMTGEDVEGGLSLFVHRLEGLRQ